MYILECFKNSAAVHRHLLYQNQHLHQYYCISLFQFKISHSLQLMEREYYLQRNQKLNVFRALQSFYYSTPLLLPFISYYYFYTHEISAMNFQDYMKITKHQAHQLSCSIHQYENGPLKIIYGVVVQLKKLCTFNLLLLNLKPSLLHGQSLLQNCQQLFYF